MKKERFYFSLDSTLAKELKRRASLSGVSPHKIAEHLVTEHLDPSYDLSEMDTKLDKLIKKTEETNTLLIKKLDSISKRI